MPKRQLGFALTTIIAALLLVPTFALAQGGTTHRPFSDFLSAQGVICPNPVPFSNPNCPGFAANYIGNTGQNFTPIERTDRFALVDYAGLESVAGALGTTPRGTVTERRLTDGTFEVRIAIHTRNALTQVRALNPTLPFPAAFGPYWFGHTAAEVTGGATPAVGDVTMELTIINPTAGAPLTDLVCYGGANCAAAPPLPSLTRLMVGANATGPLRTDSPLGVSDGTPGRMHMSQTGLIGTAIRNGFSGALVDAFPVEHIDLHVVGR